MSNSMKKRCKCVHPYQDKKYGKKIRIHNKTTKGWRCTVCGNEKGGV